MRQFKRLLAAIAIGIALIPANSFAKELCCPCHGPSDSNLTSCLTTDSEKIGSEIDCTALPQRIGLPEGWKCDQSPFQSAQCKPIADAGRCQDGPKSAVSVVAPGEARATGGAKEKVQLDPGLPFQMNVAIPGFSQNLVDADLFSNYIQAVMRYAISIVAIVATIMFIYGAFLYLVGAGLPGIKKGRQIMTDAVIGLLMVLCSVTILRTINPEIALTKSLIVEQIRTSDLGNYRADVIPTPGQLSPISKPPNAAEHIMIGARMVKGIDPCLVLAVCTHETGLRAIWNGQLSGNPKEKAIVFGPCQQGARFLHDNNPWTKQARALFADFPPPEAKPGSLNLDERLRMGDWLNSHFIGAGYIAALNLRANINSSRGNEITAVSNYYGGAGSIKKWQSANKCSPQAGVKIKDGASADLRTVACIPDYVAIPNLGEEPKGCPEDLYTCPNAKPDKTAQFVGQCSNPPRKCFAAHTSAYAKSVINIYGKLGSYDCTPGNGDTSILATLPSQVTIEPGPKQGVLLIGDSLSVGLNAPLRKLANAAGTPFASGPGEVGSNIKQWAPGGNLHSRLAAGMTNNPKIVLISLGTNDAYLIEASETAELPKLDSLIEYIQTKGGEIYWIGPPTLPTTYNSNSSANIIIGEIRSRIQSNRYFSSDTLTITRQADRLHPDGPGYTFWAGKIWEWVQQ